MASARFRASAFYREKTIGMRNDKCRSQYVINRKRTNNYPSKQRSKDWMTKLDKGQVWEAAAVGVRGLAPLDPRGELW